jgi:hypothetical protein
MKGKKKRIHNLQGKITNAFEKKYEIGVLNPAF